MRQNCPVCKIAICIEDDQASAWKYRAGAAYCCSQECKDEQCAKLWMARTAAKMTVAGAGEAAIRVALEKRYPAEKVAAFLATRKPKPNDLSAKEIEAAMAERPALDDSAMAERTATDETATDDGRADEERTATESEQAEPEQKEEQVKPVPSEPKQPSSDRDERRERKRFDVDAHTVLVCDDMQAVIQDGVVYFTIPDKVHIRTEATGEMIEFLSETFAKVMAIARKSYEMKAIKDG